MSKMSDLAYDIEQLYIEGFSPKTIAARLNCPLETVYDWLEDIGMSDDVPILDQEDEFEDDYGY
jgi:uncharacterized protein YjcR